MNYEVEGHSFEDLNRFMQKVTKKEDWKKLIRVTSIIIVNDGGANFNQIRSLVTKFTALFNQLQVKELKLRYSQARLPKEISYQLCVAELQSLRYLKFEAKDILKHQALIFEEEIE